MNKDYAEYRLRHFVRHFDLSFGRGDEAEPLTNHHEEIEGKFRRVDGVYKFGLMLTLKNAPGCAFSRTSTPFNLENTTKTQLDKIFLETYQVLISDVCSNIVLNIREGEQRAINQMKGREQMTNVEKLIKTWIEEDGQCDPAFAVAAEELQAALDADRKEITAETPFDEK